MTFPLVFFVLGLEPSLMMLTIIVDTRITYSY